MGATDSAGTGGTSVSCSLCGISVARDTDELDAGDRSASWSRWVCDRCAREHVRAIESKLDREWW